MIHFLCIVALVFLTETFSQIAVDQLACDFNEREEQTVFLGWPHRLECSLQTHSPIYSYSGDNYSDDDYSDDGCFADLSSSGYNDDLRINCLIQTISGTILFNGTTDYRSFFKDFEGETGPAGVTLPDMTETSPKDFLIFMSSQNLGSQCCTKTLHLNTAPFDAERCQNVVLNKDYSKVPYEVGTSGRFPCTVDEDLYPMVFLEDANSNDITYQWLWNCSDELPQGVTVSEDNNLIIPSINFNDAGIYSCSAQYKNMTRYVSTWDVCVCQPLTFNSPSMSCSIISLYKQNTERATFECSVVLGNGHIKNGQFTITWEKVEKNGTGMECVQSESNKTIQDDVFCTYDKPESCTLNGASLTEQDGILGEIRFRLIIRNIQDDDYGFYFIQLYQPREEVLINNVTVHLGRNPIPEILTITQIVGIAIGTVLFIFLLTLLLWCNILYIRVYYKRIFGAYDSADLPYAAILSYHASDQVDRFIRQEVTRAADVVRREIEKRLHLRLWDETRDPLGGEARTIAMQNIIQKSHRIFIILTTDYQRDHWDIRLFLEGFSERINGHMKLVFILLPGVMEYAKSRAHENSTWRALLAAIKTNYVIECRNNTALQRLRFRFQVEDALPKLRPMRNDEELTRL